MSAAAEGSGSSNEGSVFGDSSPIPMNGVVPPSPGGGESSSSSSALSVLDNFRRRFHLGTVGRQMSGNSTPEESLFEASDDDFPPHSFDFDGAWEEINSELNQEEEEEDYADFFLECAANNREAAAQLKIAVSEEACLGELEVLDAQLVYPAESELCSTTIWYDSCAITLQDERHAQEGTIINPGEYDLSDETENADPEFEVEVELASSASSTSEKSEPSKETAKAEQSGNAAKKNQPKETEKKKNSDSDVPRTPAPAPKSKPEPSDNPGKKNQPKEAEKKKGSDSEVTQTPAPKKSDEKDNKPGKAQTEVKNPGKQSKRQKRKSGGGQKGVLRPPN